MRSIGSDTFPFSYWLKSAKGGEWMELVVLFVFLEVLVVIENVGQGFGIPNLLTWG